MFTPVALSFSLYFLQDRSWTRDPGFGDTETLSDLDQSGFSGVKGMKSDWSGLKSEREQGNGMEPWGSSRELF